MQFDDILLETGDYGTYQRLLLWFVLLPGNLPCGFQAYNQLFMAIVPEHWCRVPELEDSFLNLSIEDIRNISIPYDVTTESFGSCERYDLNFSEIVSNGWWNSSRDMAQLRHGASLIPCDRGWHYHLEQYLTTVVADFDLVCEEAFLPTLALVLLGVSGLIGSYIFGYIQDSLGRRPAFFIYLTILCVCGMPTAYMPSYSWWLASRVGVGFTIPAIMMTHYVLALEIVGPSHRTYAVVIMNVAYSSTLIILAIIVYYVRIWSQLALATTIPFLAFFGYWWVLPESPRWLLTKGRVDEACKIISKIARVNKQPLREEFFAELKSSMAEELKHEEDKQKTYGAFDLFRTSNLRKKTCIVTFVWFINTAVYVGLSYYAPSLGGNAYVNFFMGAVAELPTYLFLWPAMEFWGRRWTLCFSMVLGGLACMATILANQDQDVTLALYCIGKFGISSSFVVLPLMATEIYPTVVRGTGIGISSTAGMIGPIVIPLINYLGTDMMELPLIIMGTGMVIGGLLSLLLPETVNQKLPETLAEGEKYGSHMSCEEFWNCCPGRSSKMDRPMVIPKDHLFADQHCRSFADDLKFVPLRNNNFTGDFDDSYSSLRRNSFLNAQNEEILISEQDLKHATKVLTPEKQRIEKERKKLIENIIEKNFKYSNSKRDNSIKKIQKVTVL